ncbi:MAG: carcinine hydrolase/isopenicillin-N N-acyltransferase family protein [Candidatus Thorarchaeota archaeon]
MPDGCTAGAKIIGDRYFLLKNRDLIWGGFRDIIVMENDVFFVTGINVSDGEFEGASFGFNRYGLAACNTTVLVTPYKPYDFLLERILRETKTIEDAFELVQKDLESGERYQWCNFVLASPDGVGVIEIGDGVAVLEQDKKIITRTNHHLVLPTADILRKASLAEREAGGPLNTSQLRRQESAKLLADATSMMDMTQLLSTHSESRGFDSICRHLSSNPRTEPYRGETVYSYVVEASGLDDNKLEFRLNVTPGNPCIGMFKEFVIDFDSPESKYNILTNYP